MWMQQLGEVRCTLQGDEIEMDLNDLLRESMSGSYKNGNSESVVVQALQLYISRYGF